MNKQEFINKIALLGDKAQFESDLDSVIQDEIDRRVKAINENELFEAAMCFNLKDTFEKQIIEWFKSKMLGG